MVVNQARKFTMQILQKAPSKSRLRIWLPRLVALAVVALAVGAWMGRESLLRHYRHWKQERALVQAKGFVEKRDFANARLALQVAFAAAPGDPRTLRLAAELLEQAGSPDVLTLRRRLVLMAPDSLDDRVALINTALAYRDLGTAHDALLSLPEKQLNEPAALKAALAYFLVEDNRPMADALYDRLAVMEPDNQNLRIMHALLRLRSPKAETVAEARRTLAPYAADPKLALFIHREMLRAAVLRSDSTEARQLADQLAALPGATLEDRLHAANFALTVDQRPFAEVFGSLATVAAGRAEDAAALVRWTLLVDQAPAGEAWLLTLPKEIQQAPALAPALAELAAVKKDWDGLRARLEAGAWGPVERDALRLAFTARDLDEGTKPELRRQMWDEALAAAGRSLPSLTALHRLSGIWRWDDETERSLWAITRAFPTQTWAHQTLFNTYRKRGDTVSLRNLADTLRQRDGTLLRYQHDWALLSLLTSAQPAWNAPKQMMADLYKLDPTNANYATGYAFALAQADKTDEALAVLQKIPADQLAQRARAPYLAYIYGMARRPDDYAKAATDKAALAPSLLPEENALFDAGRTALTRSLAPARTSSTAQP